MSVVQCSIYAETTLFDSCGCVLQSLRTEREPAAEKIEALNNKEKGDDFIISRLRTNHHTPHHNFEPFLPLPLNFIWAHSYNNF